MDRIQMNALETAFDDGRPLPWPTAPERVAHLPTPTPETDDEDEDEDDDRGSGGGNIDPDDDEVGPGDDDDDEDETLWTSSQCASPSG